MITDRAQQLLKILVEQYIRDGQPVASKKLAQSSELSLSSASIRHIMSDLEEMGYLSAPHTSAGRVPTVQGYRLFVDTMLTVKPIKELDVEYYKLQIEKFINSPSYKGEICALLSEVSQLAGIVSLPRKSHMKLKLVEFLPLSEKRVLVVLVLNEQDVQNRIINTDRVYQRHELESAANYINHKFAGIELHDVRNKLSSEIEQDRKNMEKLMQTVLDVAEKSFGVDTLEEDLSVSGQNKLLEFADPKDMQRLRGLFAAFSQKRDLLSLLDKCIDAQGIHIFIGEESGYEVLDDCSLVAAPYGADDECLGVLGVIGPTRMNYDRIVPLVEVTAKLLSSALNNSE